MKTKSMSVHKNLVIHCLEAYPEELQKLSPGWDGTAEELIEALKANPHEWFVDGVLQEDDESEGGK